MNRPCLEPIAPDTLLHYWLRELDDAGDARVEEHLFGCDTCTGELGRLVELADGIRAGVQRGLVGAVVSDMYTWWLRAGGLRLREYRVECNGSVQCTVAPDDDVTVARLEAELTGVETLDLVTIDAAGSEEIQRDIPFEAAAGEVLVTPRMDRLRALPATTVRMRLVAHAGGASRILGEYAFIHTPWLG